MQKKLSFDILKSIRFLVGRRIRRTNIYYNIVHKMQRKASLLVWEKNGKPTPPPHMVKQHVLLEYKKKYGLQTLVETGTYRGDMVEAMRKQFDFIFSVELDGDLHEKAQIRFRNVDNVNLIRGDSGVEMKQILKNIKTPTLFWLDGHYSGGNTAKGLKETPICEELKLILDELDMDYVILIDDARMFGIDPAYPSIENLTDFITAKKQTNLAIAIEDDIIRITPSS